MPPPIVLAQTNAVKALHTAIRDKTASRHQVTTVCFLLDTPPPPRRVLCPPHCGAPVVRVISCEMYPIHMCVFIVHLGACASRPAHRGLQFVTAANRLTRLLIEEALSHLPATPCTIETPCGPYEGVKLPDESSICAVSILRAADCMLGEVRVMMPSVAVGKILIQRDEATALPALMYSKLPPDIKSRPVLLLDPMLATGGSAVMACKVLVDAGVPAENIIFVNVVCVKEGLPRSRPPTRPSRSSPAQSTPSSTRKSTSCPAWATLATATLARTACKRGEREMAQCAEGRACTCARVCGCDDVVHTITAPRIASRPAPGACVRSTGETIAGAAWASTWGLLHICTSPFSFFHGLSTARIMQQLFYMLAAYSRPARPCIYLGVAFCKQGKVMWLVPMLMPTCASSDLALSSALNHCFHEPSAP